MDDLVDSQSMPLDPVEIELKSISGMIHLCQRCPLGLTRIKAVSGAGSAHARLMFIGEAPGAREDSTGEPFVGASGKLLTATLSRQGISRDEVFISNIIKCRPPGNRDPLPAEIEACTPYLRDQIRVIKPDLLCSLGRHAASVLLGRKIAIMKERGRWQEYEGRPMMICLHPSAVLYQRANQGFFEQDIAALAQRYFSLENP